MSQHFFQSKTETASNIFNQTTILFESTCQYNCNLRHYICTLQPLQINIVLQSYITTGFNSLFIEY
jgi:hypothetical protein